MQAFHYFLNAADLGYTGTELQEQINTDPLALARLETIRAFGALKMGLIQDIAEAASRQHTPKIAFVAPPLTYMASSGSRSSRKILTCWSVRCRWVNYTML